MQAKPYILPYNQQAHKGHNKPFVAKGTLVYAVEHKGQYFAYAYVDKAQAQYIAEKFALTGVQELATLLAFNFRDKPSVVSGIKREVGAS